MNQVGLVVEREEELPAANEWKDVYEAFLAEFGEQDSYAFFRRLHTAMLPPRRDTKERAAKLDGLLRPALDPQDRVTFLLEGLLKSFHARREALSDCIGTPEASRLLGLSSRQAVHARVEARQLLAVKVKDELQFPAWQFDPSTETGVLEGLPETLQALRPRNTMWALLWLRTTQRSLDSRTAIDALRSGEAKQVIAFARAAVAD